MSAPSSGRRVRLVPVLFVLVLLASAANVWLALNRSDSSGSTDPERPGVSDGGYRPAELAGPGGAALDVAVDVVALALTYDFRDLTGSRDRADEAMTRAFAATFDREFARSVAPAARAQRRVTDVVVRAAGLVRVDGDDRARCLVYLDQRLLRAVGQPASSGPRVLARERVLVDLVRRGEAWLVDRIAPL